MNIKTILAVIAILSALAWAGEGDFADERQQFALYCQHLALTLYGPTIRTSVYGAVRRT